MGLISIDKKVIKDKRLSDINQSCLFSIEEIIEDARNGKMFILVDDENRENEGDLIIPAQFATPDAINFMAKEGRGLICLAMEGKIADRLGLHLVGNRDNGFSTAFTISIEAKKGVTTGISAADRAKTVQVAIDPETGAQDLSSPGHVFPLRAKDGGVLVRAGHTEAAVDIAKLAGLRPAGVICEIMKDDGTMARLPDLISFSQLHNLKIGTIADLIAYRRRAENLVVRQETTTIKTEDNQELKYYLYKDIISGVEHIALVKGNIKPDNDILVRMHSMNVLSDVLGMGESHLKKAMKEIANSESGVFVLIRDDTHLSLVGMATNKNNEKSSMLRDYGVGAQILRDLGVRNMILLSNSKKNIAGLDGYDLKITGHKNI